MLFRSKKSKVSKDLNSYCSDLGWTQRYALTELLSLILKPDTPTGMVSASQVGCTSFVFVHITRLANTIPGLRIRHYNHRPLQQTRTKLNIIEGPHTGHMYRDGVSEPSRMHNIGACAYHEAHSHHPSIAHPNLRHL